MYTYINYLIMKRQSFNILVTWWKLAGEQKQQQYTTIQSDVIIPYNKQKLIFNWNFQLFVFN